jgi:hypothetical protein
MGRYLERYVGGDYEAVWAELFTLGDAVHADAVWEDARAVAGETMRRVRANVETVVARLEALGYPFEDRVRAHIPPPPNISEHLDRVEEAVGARLPLSMRAFYELVGAVDLRRSGQRLVAGFQRDDEIRRELTALGSEDPLLVEMIRPPGAPDAEWTIDDPAELERGGHDHRVRFEFAMDPIVKAHQSGGEGHSVPLHGGVDFEVVGLIGARRTFVEYLRAYLRHGGFRGHVFERRPPPQRVCAELGAGLLPF